MRQLIESVGAASVFFDWSKYRYLYGPGELSFVVFFYKLGFKT